MTDNQKVAETNSDVQPAIPTKLPAAALVVHGITGGPIHDGMLSDCELCSSQLGEPIDAPADLGTYGAMMDEYLQAQRHWIGPAQQPLVFHMRKLCQKLDANPDAPASLSSAYLQAFRRLDLQRPGNTQPAGSAGDLPGQGSIFDELDN